MGRSIDLKYAREQYVQKEWISIQKYWKGSLCRLSMLYDKKMCHFYYTLDVD